MNHFVNKWSLVSWSLGSTGIQFRLSTSNPGYTFPVPLVRPWKFSRIFKWSGPAFEVRHYDHSTNQNGFFNSRLIDLTTAAPSFLVSHHFSSRTFLQLFAEAPICFEYLSTMSSFVNIILPNYYPLMDLRTFLLKSLQQQIVKLIFRDLIILTAIFLFPRWIIHYALMQPDRISSLGPYLVPFHYQSCMGHVPTKKAFYRGRPVYCWKRCMRISGVLVNNLFKGNQVARIA